MKFSKSLFSFCILSFILVLSCSTEEVQDTTPPPSIIQNPEPEPETEDETQAESENQTTDSAEEYFSVNYEGNGTYTRFGAPHSPMDTYYVELIEGEVNDKGEFLKGSTLKLKQQANPGWDFKKEYSSDISSYILNRDEYLVETNVTDFHYEKWENILNGEPFLIDQDLIIPINVKANSDFLFLPREANGMFQNVGKNLLLYPEWNQPSNEYNWYVTNNFSWPGYVEAYKDRLYQITQVVGDFGPLDILIFDWEADPDHNREMYAESRKEYGIGLYENQIYPFPNGGNGEVDNYDRVAAEGGYPFGSASARLGGRKYVGEINKDGKKEILTNWSNHLGITIEELLNRDEFHWDWVGIHEPLHIWQVSSEKHGWMNDIGGCTYCGLYSEIGFDKYEKLFDKLNPRWFFEGQVIALEDWFMEKIGLREWPDDSGYEDTEKIMAVRYKLKNRWFKGHREDGFDRLQRHEYKEDLLTILSVAGVYIEEGLGVLNGFEGLTPVKGYFDTGIIASYYMFAKMNHDLDNYLEFNTVRGADGFDVAMQQFLGLTEQQFYDEFNTWFFDSGLTDDQKIDYLWPEGTDPIQIDIQSRR